MDDPAKVLEALLELNEQLADERSLNRALRLVSDTTLALLPGDHASVRVLDHTRTELLCSARAGLGEQHKPAAFRSGQGVLGWVVEQGEVARVIDARQDPRFVERPGQGFSIRAILAVPLWSAGEVVGALAATAPEVGAFSEQDERLARLLANSVVPPIETARLARLAVTDPQTMAFNQGYLVPGLQIEMERATDAPLSILVLNLDHFKLINEQHGAGAGDSALREFTNRIRATTREHDSIVRRGGDEFVLIMPGAGEVPARKVAERIRHEMETSPIELGQGHTAQLTVSIGGAHWDGRESPQALEKRAGAAMYAAKLHGRNRLHFD